MPKTSQSRACQSSWPGVICESDFAAAAAANNFWISCNLHYFFTYRLLDIVLFFKHKHCTHPYAPQNTCLQIEFYQQPLRILQWLG